jgi:hypothetical protein
MTAIDNMTVNDSNECPSLSRLQVPLGPAPLPGPGEDGKMT